MKYLPILVILILCRIGSQAQTSIDSSWYPLGAENYMQGKLDDAIFCFSKSIKVGVRVAISYTYRAAAEMLDGKLNEAQADLNAALKIDPRESYAYYFMAKLNFKQANTDEALFNSRKAVQLNPSDADFNDLLALAYGNKGKYDSALVYAQQAVTIDPSDAVYQSNLALARQNLGQYQEATDEYAKAMGLARDTSTASIILANAAYCFFKLEKYEDALEICTRVINNDASYTYAYMVRANIYYAMKDNAHACTDLKTVLASDAGNTDAKKLFTQCSCK